MSPPDRPTLVNRKANLAAGVHTRKSAASAITAPAPAAMPWTAAMTGTGQSRISRMTSPLIRVKASSPSGDMASVAPMISYAVFCLKKKKGIPEGGDVALLLRVLASDVGQWVDQVVLPHL